MFIETLKKCHINHRYTTAFITKNAYWDTYTIKEMEPAVHLYIRSSVCGRKGLGFCALLQLASQTEPFFWRFAFYF